MNSSDRRSMLLSVARSSAKARCGGTPNQRQMSATLAFFASSICASLLLTPSSCMYFMPPSSTAILPRLRRLARAGTIRAKVARVVVRELAGISIQPPSGRASLAKKRAP
jgi:hypothetical protein